MPIKLQEWQSLSESERSALWLEYEKTDPAELNNLWNIEWQLAQDYFNKIENSNQFKLDHKGKNAITRHSFIQIDGEIYMLARKDKLIGEGAFGKVKPSYFKDEEVDVLNSKGEQHLVKVIKCDDITAEVAVENEAYALDQLGELYAKGERVLADGSKKFYLVAKRHEGTVLIDLLNDDKLSRAELLIIAYQCCDLVEQAHKKGILHLDLKPENIIVDIKDGVIKVKLIDWGLSTQIHDFQDFTSVDMVGTPGFIPPEILDADPKASKASDVFSLGAMFKNDFLLLPSEYDKLLQHDPHKRSSLKQQKQTLLTALDLLLDDEKTPGVLKFIDEVKNSKVPEDNDSISLKQSDEHSSQPTLLTSILDNLKQSRVDILLRAEDRWILEAQALGLIINNLEKITTDMDLDDNEKLAQFEKAIKKHEQTYYGKIKIILGEQCGSLMWQHDYNKVYDTFTKVIAPFSLEDKDFFQQQADTILDAFDDIDSNDELSYAEKTAAFYKAIIELQDSCLLKAIEDPRFFLVVDGFKEALLAFSSPPEIDKEDVDESAVDQLLEEFGISINKNEDSTAPEVINLMRELQIDPEEPSALSLQMGRLIESLIEYNQIHPTETLTIIIDSLQSKMQRVYYQRNPKQCLEAVMAENSVAMEDIDTAVFLLEQLEPWQVAAPKLKEQASEFIQAQEWLAQQQLDEEKKLALLKENIFDYAVHLFRQKSSLSTENVELYSSIIKQIISRKRIDTDNESFLISLLSLQSTKADQLRYAAILNDILEIYQQLGAEYHIDLAVLPEKLTKKKEMFREFVVDQPSRPVKSTLVADLDLRELYRLLTVDEDFLNKHAVIKMILRGLQENLAIIRDPSASLLVLEMTKLVQKIESLPDDIPHRSKLGIIKQYLLNKQNELKNQRAIELLNQLNDNVTSVFSNITNSLQDQEWSRAISVTQQGLTQRILSSTDVENIALFERAIDLLSSKYLEINRNDSIKSDHKPNNDDLAAISSQIQHKLGLYKEGLLKINPAQELQIIFSNAAHNPRLAQLVSSVAIDLNIELDIREDKSVERNPAELANLKLANAKRTEEILRIKKNWTQLAEELCAKATPDKTDYLAFSEQLFNDAISNLNKLYKNANKVQMANLSTHVIPMLEQHFKAARDKVLNHYIRSVQEQISALKKEHAVIADKEREAQLCQKSVLKKLGLAEKPDVNPDAQYVELKLVIAPGVVEEQIAHLKPVTAPKRVIDASSLERVQQQKLAHDKAQSQLRQNKLQHQMKQVDLEYLKVKKQLDDAYHLIIAYDPKAPKGSIPHYVEVLSKAKEEAIRQEQKRLKNVELAQAVSAQIQEVQLANRELESQLERERKEVEQDLLAKRSLILQQIESAMMPISLDDPILEADLVEPFSLVVPASMPANQYQRLPLTDSLLHLQEQALHPQPEAGMRVEIFQALLDEHNKQAEILVAQHRVGFAFNDQDSLVIQKINEIAQKVKKLQQQTANNQGPSLPDLLKKLHDLKSEHAALLTGHQQQMNDLKGAHDAQSILLKRFLNNKREERNARLAKLKDASQNLDAILLDPVSEYHAMQKHHEQRFARKWFKSQAKAAGRRIYGKERSRNKQTKFIEDMFLGIQQDIAANDILSVKERAMMAYQCLAQVQSEILDEKNVFSSDLFKVCDKQMRKIEEVLQSLKALETPVAEKPLMTEEAFLKSVYYQARNAADQELPLEMRILHNCKIYNAIPQSNMHFGEGGTLTMLESSIQRELATVRYFAESGSSHVRAEAIKLLAKLENNDAMKTFVDKFAMRRVQMSPVKKVLPGNDLQKVSNKDRKLLIAQKVAALQKEYLTEPKSAKLKPTD